MHTKKTQTAASAFRAAFPLTLPVMAGYIFLGMTYGILMVTSGFPVYYPILTAVIVYTGSMEFLLVSILLSPYHPMACFLTALMDIFFTESPCWIAIKGRGGRSFT